MEYIVRETLNKNKTNIKGIYNDIAQACQMCKHYSYFTRYRYTVETEEGVICSYRSGKQVKNV